MKSRQIARWCAPPDAERATESDRVKYRVANDLKFLIEEILHAGIREQLSPLGYIHDILCDFMRWEEPIPDEFRHSSLHEHAISKMKPGEEVWVYWPRIQRMTPDGPVTCKPEVYFGRDHEMYRRWVNHEPILGVLVRVVGNGNWKSYLIPRNFLKSTFARAKVIQQIVRDNASRIMFRTAESALAMVSVSAIKSVFDSNREFKKWFGHLKPDGRGELWSTEAIRVVSDVRRGVDPTLWAAALTTDVVGFRPEFGVLDDVVNKKNLNQADAIYSKFQEFLFNLDNTWNLLDIFGTRHQDNDLYGRTCYPSGETDEVETFDYMSFMFATIKDAYDEYTWPEGFNENIEKQKGAALSQHQKNCQWYNNPYALSSRKFKDEWRIWYHVPPEEQARKSKYAKIVLTIDPAHTAGEDSDYTTAMVQGQLPDKTRRDVLDGIRDRLPLEDIPSAIMDLAEKWWKIAQELGCEFDWAVEAVAFQTALKYPLRDEAIKRNLVLPEIKEVKPLNRSKGDRIAVLIPYYSARMIAWPAGDGIQKTSIKGRRYNFVDAIYDEYSKWPHVSHDDVLDVQAYGEDMFGPMLYKEIEEASIAQTPKFPDVTKRADVLEDVPQGRYVPENSRVYPEQQANIYIPAFLRGQ